ncbi:MAG: hypothetical protein H0U44_06475 [Flavisolibacter sp.]|nr:hypothetical protein [Flavisolibacter sp.]
MRIIKLAIISFILIFLLITLMSLLIPSQVRISRAINMGQHQKGVLHRISDTSRWAEWHPAYIHLEKSGTPNNMRRDLKSFTGDELIYDIVQASRRPVMNGWKLYSYPAQDSITLQWYIDIRLSWYPWEKFSSLFFESAYGRMMEEGLTNLNSLE